MRTAQEFDLLLLPYLPHIWQNRKTGIIYFVDTSNGEPCFYELEGPANSVVLFQSSCQYIQIFQTKQYGKALAIDGTIQCAERDEARYHEAFVHPAMMLHAKPRAILICGGGDGATLREALKHPSVEKATLVDIDREVICLTQKHMPFLWAGAERDKRARILSQDALRYLEQSNETFDIIFSDITDPTDGVSLPLFSEKYFRLLKKRLNPGGIAVAQGAEVSEIQHAPERLNIRNHMRSVFGKKYVAAYHSYIPSYREERAFFMATTGPPAWFDASHLPPWSLRKTRAMQDSFRFYSPQMHAALFAASPAIQKIYEHTTENP